MVSIGGGQYYKVGKAGKFIEYFVCLAGLLLDVDDSLQVCLGLSEGILVKLPGIFRKNHFHLIHATQR